MTELHPPEWNAVLARVGAPARVPSAKTDAGRRVDRLLPRLNARAPDAEIALSLLTAAASGPLRERLLAMQARVSAHSGPRPHHHVPRTRTQRPAFARVRALLGLKSGGPASAPTGPIERPDVRLWRETSAVISAASPPELDRDAAIDGLRQLFEKRRLSGERVEAILRRLSETH
ncbi:hypothetical protein [Conyzicola sp.]|uniref:hypothetical protein n=1 Tax=Conyzicola sp. TaxID=1969404 RepID=UPI003989264A